MLEHLGINGQRFLVGIEGFIILPARKIRGAEIAVDRCGIRIHFQSALVLGDRFAIVLLRVINSPEIVDRF